MCGIFGYIGKSNKASSIVFDGLKRLEYRGYDSWGIAVADKNTITATKKVGAIGDLATLDNLPDASVAIGHTRWATHGGVTENNAHPHYASDKSFILAQNGIVENYEALKAELAKKGYRFETETDTEVIVRLIEDCNKQTKDLQAAVQTAFTRLKGRNTIILLTAKGTIIAARNGSPLVIGLNTKTNETFFSSDTLSFTPYADSMIVVDNGELIVFDEKIALFDLQSGRKIEPKIEKISFTAGEVSKKEFDHFMIKEINETPFVVEQVIRQDKHRLEDFVEAIRSANQVYTIGSGTAGIAAAQIAYYLRHFGKTNAISLVGADAKEYYDLIGKGDLIIAPSQSGETADVLEVLEFLKEKGVSIASYVNMPGSMMTKMSDYKFMAEAGPEICVMSTKVFTSQIAFGYLLGKTVAGEYDSAVKNLQDLADNMRVYLENSKNHEVIKELASHLRDKKDIFLLGKSQNFQIIREGMVKLIEATYKHAHALPAGDLKHYAITLIEKGVPVVVAVSDDDVQADVLNAVSEVKTRGAEVIGISSQPHYKFDYFLQVPGKTSAIMNVIPLQLLAYYMTVVLGNNVDKPRNIAKSVTVK